MGARAVVRLEAVARTLLAALLTVHLPGCAVRADNQGASAAIVLPIGSSAAAPSGASTRPAREASAAGAGFRDCPHCPEMTPVVTGSFVMGSQRAADESPTRRVTIARRFAYSKAKISAFDWKQCVLAGVCQSVGATSTASHDPVVMVAWVDVQQYLLWLGLETGAEYRLLSEAEWEYLAGSSASGFRADGLEWTSDCWHADYTGAPTDGSSWDARGDCRYHVARGRRPAEAASPLTRRYRFLFDARDPALGFRVARTLRE